MCAFYPCALYVRVGPRSAGLIMAIWQMPLCNQVSESSGTTGDGRMTLYVIECQSCRARQDMVANYWVCVSGSSGRTGYVKRMILSLCVSELSGQRGYISKIILSKMIHSTPS